jgi:hypothetical protein
VHACPEIQSQASHETTMPEEAKERIGRVSNDDVTRDSCSRIEWFWSSIGLEIPAVPCGVEAVGITSILGESRRFFCIVKEMHE